MATVDNSTTRYCRACSGAMAATVAPGGDAVLTCPGCGYTVAIETVASSTLAAPRRTLRRRLYGTARATARALSADQARQWDDRRQGALDALQAVLDLAVRDDAGAVQALAEVL